MTSNRPPTLVTAAILLVLISLGNLALPLLAKAGTPPGPILIVAGILAIAGAIAGLIGAAGLWIGRQWARPLTIIVAVLTGLAGVPGFLFAPSAVLVAGSAATVACAAAIVVLVLLPGSRRAYA